MTTVRRFMTSWSSVANLVANWAANLVANWAGQRSRGLSRSNRNVLTPERGCAACRDIPANRIHCCCPRQGRFHQSGRFATGTGHQIIRDGRATGVEYLQNGRVPTALGAVEAFALTTCQEKPVTSSCADAFSANLQIGRFPSFARR